MKIQIFNSKDKYICSFPVTIIGYGKESMEQAIRDELSDVPTEGEVANMKLYPMKNMPIILPLLVGKLSKKSMGTLSYFAFFNPRSDIRFGLTRY
jgi:hypothetical protein